MVANNLFGLSSNWATIFWLLELDSAASCTVVFDKEKKATSAPEINAENINNINNETTLSVNQMFEFWIINKNVGSGSKLF